MARLTRLVPRALLLVAGLVLGLILVELGTRALWSYPPPALATHCSQLDQFGVIHGGIPAGEHHAMRTPFSGDGLGFRALGQAAEPAGGEPILVLGDSFVFGIGVTDEQTMPAQLASSLAAAGAPRTVWNGGQVALSLSRRQNAMG